MYSIQIRLNNSGMVLDINYSVIDKKEQLDMLVYDFYLVVIGSALTGGNVDGMARRNQLYIQSGHDVRGVHVGSRNDYFNEPYSETNMIMMGSGMNKEWMNSGMCRIVRNGMISYSTRCGSRRCGSRHDYLSSDTDKANNWYELIYGGTVDEHYGPGITRHSRNKPWQPPAGLEHESYMGSRIKTILCI